MAPTGSPCQAADAAAGGRSTNARHADGRGDKRDKMKSKIILDLCGGTGAWSKPYFDKGYDVRNITLPYFDVRTYESPKNVYGILAAPPCTVFASSGARWWKEKGEKALTEGMSIVDACLRIIFTTNPHFWCLENPVGRLRRYIGEPIMYFDPCDYGDSYIKQTCLWGKFNLPKKNPVRPEKKSPIYFMPPSKERSKLRSITPLGFARAFFEANQ